jgi:translation initiation factor 3 subunit C
LKQAEPLYTTLVKAQCLFERENSLDAVARIVIRRLEHLYSRPDVFITIFERAANTACAGLQSTVSPIGGEAPSSAVLIHRLAAYVYQSEAPLLRARAILMHIFHHAMHARYHQARDQLLMSHMQESVQQADVTTQILYNRAVMQVGLAAFRCGYIAECQTIMADMMSTQRYRELLGQSIQRYNTQLSPEQELVEKRRLLPFHMHLNHELLEAAYLTSCMLVEVPLLASVNTDEQRRKIASKTFKRLLDMNERSAFDGLPENNRDHVIKAARALQGGDWTRSKELLLSAKIWNLIDNSVQIKEMLSRKIQIEGLRTYLFTNSPYYVSVSFSHLADAFSLPISTVASIVSRMIYNDELQASLDQIKQVIVFHRVEQTEIQSLSLQLADRVNALVEQNEKALDQKLGQGQQDNRQKEGGGDGGNRGERRGGTRGNGRGRGRGRGFQGGAMGQRRVPA